MELADNTVVNRLAELHTIKKSRGYLSAEEYKEFEICLDWISNYCWKVSCLYNLSYIAYSSGDDDWHIDICSKIDVEQSK